MKATVAIVRLLRRNGPGAAALVAAAVSAMSLSNEFVAASRDSESVVACVLVRGGKREVLRVGNLAAAARWSCSLIFVKDERALHRDHREIEI